MKKVILSLAVFLLSELVCGAVEVVYPRAQNVTINSGSTFFVGNSDREFKINGQTVPRNKKGAFAYVVKLNVGENFFTLEDSVKKEIFKITRPAPKNYSGTLPEQIDYTGYKTVMTAGDSIPLRSTPVDAGINRLSHLPSGVMLTVSGEKNGFYRVVLENQEAGWVAKHSLIDVKENSAANLKGYDYIDTDEFYTFVFHLDKKVPFVIEEGSTMVLKLYNVKDNSPYIMEFPYTEASGSEKLFGYSGEFIGNDFIWKIRKPLKTDKKHPLKGIRIAVDAGHGGYESGAISCFGEKEKDINLLISKYLRNELKKRGADVYMTRTHDKYHGLKERVDSANEQNSVILISIHGNALPDNLDPNKNSGTSIFYYYDMAKPLADCIIKEMTKQLGMNNDKVRQASLALVRNTNALSILIEVGYLINPDDSALLREADFQKAAAHAIADGIEKYLIDD